MRQSEIKEEFERKSHTYMTMDIIIKYIWPIALLLADDLSSLWKNHYRFHVEREVTNFFQRSCRFVSHEISDNTRSASSWSYQLCHMMRMGND